MSKRISTVLLSVAVLLLLVFNVSLWAWTTVLNTDAFVNRTGEALTQEESRDAIAARIVDQLLADRPLVLSAVGDTLEGVVSGVLGSDRFRELFAALSTAIHRTLTAGGVDDITIDISRLREIMIAVLTVINPDGEAASQIANQPDEIVLFEGRDFPAMRRIADTIPWVCAISGLLAGALIAGVIAATPDRRSAIRRLGLMLVVSAIVMMILQLSGRWLALEPFPLADQRTIVATLFDAYARRLFAQSILLLLIGGGLFAWAMSWALPETRSAQLSPEPTPNTLPSGTS